MTTRTLQTVAVARRRRRSGGFNVRRLFINGEAGGVYDPSDLTAEKVAWRRNLLTWSEDFTNAAWGKIEATVTANAGVSWDGTNTATKLIASATTNIHVVRQDNPYPTVRPSVPYVMSIYAKAAELSWIYLLSLGRTPTDSASEASAWFNLSTGTVGTQLRCSATLEPVGNGWYRCSILTATAGLSASSQRELRVGVTSGNTVSTFTGDGTSGVLIDSAQMEPFSLTAYQRITDFTSDFLATFPTHGLYQDAAGTTPVTALGQPVGLVIDSKTGGLANLGPEQLSNNEFTSNVTGWSAAGSATVTWDSSGAALVDITGAGGGIQDTQTLALTTGRMYRVTVSVRAGTYASQLALQANNVTIAVITPTATYQTVSAYFTAPSADPPIALLRNLTATGTIFVDFLSVREVPGVHAIQPTNSSRPLLDGRVNLLTFSEQFDNAAWSKTNVTVTANAAAAPDGTTTADAMLENSSAFTSRALVQNQTVGASQYVMWCDAKPTGSGSKRFLLLYPQGVTTAYAIFDVALGTVTFTGGANFVAASIEARPNGYYRCFITFNTTAGTLSSVAYLSATGTSLALNYTGDGVSGLLLWGADLRLAADAAYPYQRVVTATDYADVGVPRSFLFDGFDDSLYTASNMDLSGTDKVTVLAGVRKLSDAAEGTVCELSAAANGNNGAFAMRAPWDINANADYAFQSRGTSFVNAQSAAFRAADTAVLTGQGDIAGDVCTLRRNGTQIALDASDQGTGNYGSYVLFIGRRNNASLPFNGKAYQLIVRGALTDAATLAQAERYVGAKTGLAI